MLIDIMLEKSYQVRYYDGVDWDDVHVGCHEETALRVYTNPTIAELGEIPFDDSSMMQLVTWVDGKKSEVERSEERVFIEPEIKRLYKEASSEQQEVWDILRESIHGIA